MKERYNEAEARQGRGVDVASVVLPKLRQVLVVGKVRLWIAPQ